MSIPNYLSKIKSSGVYRYVFDKSEIPASERNSIRLVVGYSEKGPFNTPVYFDDVNEFIQTHGNISRRMERKGIFFNRMCIQALSAGPILALNLKPFNSKKEYNTILDFNATDVAPEATLAKYPETADASSIVRAGYIYSEDGGSIYDTNRFWKITENLFDITPYTLDEKNHEISDKEDAPGTVDNKEQRYFRLVQTGSKEDSVTLFMRPFTPKNWDVKISEWYSNETAEDMPSYMEAISDQKLSDFFMEIYVFKGNLNKKELFENKGGTLGAYGLVPYKCSDFTKATETDEDGNLIYDFEYEGVKYVFNNAATAEPVNDRKGMTEGYLENGENNYIWVKVWQPFCKWDVDSRISTNGNFYNIYGERSDALDAMSVVNTSNFIGRYAGITFPSFKDANGSFISIDSIFNSATAYHKCLLSLNEALLDDAYDADLNDNGIYEDTEIERSPEDVGEYIKQLVTDPTVKDGDDDSVKSIIGYYLKGFSYSTITKGMNGETLVKKIMEVLQYKGMREALTNNVDIDYKYWVDTFQAYKTPALRADVAEILNKKFNCLGILNFPPMPDLLRLDTGRTSTGAITTIGGWDMNKLVTSQSITLPSESQGASWCAFYTQLKMTDGTNTFYAPSAALVSNLFMEKRSTGQPYNIVAGPNYGRINYPGVVGPDYNYARQDLDALEPFGVNAIIYIPRYGIVINSNQTAKQTPVSALSKVHVRELITYIQDTIQDMLYGYQWELNTSSLRDAIKAKADVILGVVQCNGGIYAFTTKCDDQNNTQEIIDNEMVVLDMEIEPARGAGKMVQTLTIHRTGALSNA